MNYMEMFLRQKAFKQNYHHQGENGFLNKQTKKSYYLFLSFVFSLV